MAALPEALRLDRQAVRPRAQERFGVERMVEDYLRVYRTLLA